MNFYLKKAHVGIFSDDDSSSSKITSDWPLGRNIYAHE